LAHPREWLQTNRAHTLRASIVHDLPGELVGEVAHPAALFALAFADRSDFARSLQPLATREEAATYHPLRASIAPVACAVASHMDDGGHLHPQVYAHNAVLSRRLGRGPREGDLGDPLVALALDAP
jgi:hypothetical protein